MLDICKFMWKSNKFNKTPLKWRFFENFILRENPEWWTGFFVIFYRISSRASVSGVWWQPPLVLACTRACAYWVSAPGVSCLGCSRVRPAVQFNYFIRLPRFLAGLVWPGWYGRASVAWLVWVGWPGRAVVAGLAWLRWCDWPPLPTGVAGLAQGLLP